MSGGEATEQIDFLVDLFTAVKSDPALTKLTTFVDTNGSAPRRVWDRLAPVMDGAMVDLKAIDEKTHIQLTAASNVEVLASIEYLASIDRLYEVRLLIMPGYNDDPDTVERTTQWLRTVDPNMRIVVIGFRSHGLRPGFEYLTEASPEATEAIGEQVRSAGFSDVLVV